MAYATVDDMVLRFGRDELTRLTTPAGQDLVDVVPAPALSALEDVSGQIDTYLRKRYAVPLDIVPSEIQRAACHLARFELSLGEQREASDQVRQMRKETLDWLVKIAEGKVVLDLQVAAPGDESHAMMQSRDSIFPSGGGAWP